MINKQLYLLMILILVSACSGSKKTANSKVNTSEEPEIKTNLTEEIISDEPKASEPKQNIANANVVPGTPEVSGCSVKATLLTIYPEVDSQHPESPCGQVPCGALIRIDTIVRMGQQCGPFVVPGAELKAYFRFTLSRTDEFFPDMQHHFPGLVKNDKFAASFVATREFGDDGYQVVIYTYTKAE